MGFAKNLAQIGASFIPGVGPLASAAIGAIGGGGKQGSQNYNGTQSSTQKIDQTNSIDQFNEAVEDPQFAAMRQGLIPMFQQEMRKANQPIYGDAQKASYLNDLNDLGSGAMASIRNSLSGRGALDSGAMSEAMAGVGRQKFSQAADFFGKLPQMEEESRAQRMGGLLGMGMNWAGRAPISQRTTGTNTIKGTTESKGTNNGTQTQYGPGFLGSFAQGVGGMMGANAARPGSFQTMGDQFGYPGFNGAANQSWGSQNVNNAMMGIDPRMFG
jgi:hypothetical protein